MYLLGRGREILAIFFLDDKKFLLFHDDGCFPFTYHHTFFLLSVWPGWLVGCSVVTHLVEECEQTTRQLQVSGRERERVFPSFY